MIYRILLRCRGSGRVLGGMVTAISVTRVPERVGWPQSRNCPRCDRGQAQLSAVASPACQALSYSHSMLEPSYFARVERTEITRLAIAACPSSLTWVRSDSTISGWITAVGAISDTYTPPTEFVASATA